MGQTSFLEKTKNTKLVISIIKGKNYKCRCTDGIRKCTDCDYNLKHIISTPSSANLLNVGSDHEAQTNCNEQELFQSHFVPNQRKQYIMNKSSRQSAFYLYVDKKYKITKKTACHLPSQFLKIAMLRCKKMM